MSLIGSKGLKIEILDLKWKVAAMEIVSKRKDQKFSLKAKIKGAQPKQVKITLLLKERVILKRMLLDYSSVLKYRSQHDSYQ